MTYSISVIVLILTNLIPLMGVLFFEWSIASIIFLYWLENVVIGFYNVLKMITVRRQTSPGTHVPRIMQYIAKAFTIGFFILHYGAFTAAHGLVVTRLLQAFSPYSFREVLVGFIALLVSHGVSFAQNFIGKEEYARVTLGTLMHQPYHRVLVMHISILLGVVVGVMLTPTPLLGVLVVLIILKTFLDLGAHIREHKNVAQLPFPPAAHA